MIYSLDTRPVSREDRWYQKRIEDQKESREVPLIPLSYSSTLPGNCYSRESFLMALLQTNLDEEKLDVFMQNIFELTKDFNMIDLEVINQHWPPRGNEGK